MSAIIACHQELSQQIEKMHQLRAFPAHIQKIYSTLNFLAVQVRSLGKTYWLVIGRGNGKEWVGLHHSPPPPSLRIRDFWLEWLRKNWSGKRLDSIELDKADRVVKFEFSSKGKSEQSFIFWCGRQTFFAHQFPEMTFSSWGNIEGKLTWESFNFLGRKTLPASYKASLPYTNFDWVETHEENGLEKKKNLETKIQKKIKLIEADLKNFEEIPQLKKAIHELDPDVLNGVFKWKSWISWKIPLGLKGFALKSYLFEKAKNLEKAKKIQEQRLENFKAEKSNPPAKEAESAEAKGPQWVTQKKRVVERKEQVSTDKGYKIIQMEEFKLGIGLNAQGNDQLRKEWGQDQDWWIHLSSGKSAHAIIKYPKDEPLKIEHINQAAQHIRGEEAQVDCIVTQLKNVKGVPGKAGLVNYKKHKVIRCFF